ncbi:MAG: DUF362 domain-containing protein [Deltaproteobacteria bacterium]|nr:DUF362 domain-containing protein [Deltaproteobacteria bacterium]
MSFTRREFLLACAGGIVLGVGGSFLWQEFKARSWDERTFIAKVTEYRRDLSRVIRAGFRELGLTPAEIRGKRVLLKPNLVETSRGMDHINTHPLVVRGAVEAFLAWGAARITVAEGPGHITDTLRVLEESGLQEVLREDRIPFIDVNYEDVFTAANAGGVSRLSTLSLPVCLKEADWIVSLAKLKTHHWSGVTLSMKNLFGLMPGSIYGWPKNPLHWAGIDECILDITATARPHFAIVDGIIGMEGDGPIMGDPKHAGVLIMGRNLPAVDATSARIMGVNPHRIRYLSRAEMSLGPIRTSRITQVGEPLAAVRTPFRLLEQIPAQRGLREG